MIYYILLGLSDSINQISGFEVIQNCTVVLSAICLLAVYHYSQSLTIHDSIYMQKAFIKAPTCENSNSYLTSLVRHSKAPLSLFSPSFDRQLTYCVCLRHTMITNIALATTSIQSHSHHFFFVVRTFMIYFLSNFQVCNTVFINYNHHSVHQILRTYSSYNWKFIPLVNISSVPPFPSPW